MSQGVNTRYYNGNSALMKEIDMGDYVDESVANSGPAQYKFTSIRSPDYRLEFINGALSNVTPRGEIVCNFHFESKDMPTEQVATRVEDGSGAAKLCPFQDPGTFTRDVKFGIVINAQFARDLVRLLKDKIEECETVIASASKKGENA